MFVRVSKSTARLAALLFLAGTTGAGAEGPQAFDDDRGHLLIKPQPKAVPVAAPLADWGKVKVVTAEQNTAPKVVNFTELSATEPTLQPQIERAKAAAAIGAAPVGPVDLDFDWPLIFAESVFEGTRRRPGRDPVQKEVVPIDPAQVPSPQAFEWPKEVVPVPDRWRIVESIGVNEHWWDPYNQSTLKGDRPIFGTNDWFFNLAVISDTVIEPRSFSLPVGNQTTTNSGEIGLFGGARSFVFNQNLITSFALIQGDTAFKPPDVEVRITPVFNINYADVDEKRILFVDPSKGITRTDYFIGLQEAFFDYHIRNVSDRFDFDSFRIGIQPFNSDFRGFLFQDQQLGIRLFGTRDGNRFQYNAGWFRRLEKDTNSGLNDVTIRPRDDDIFYVNLYRQDFPIPALTTQATLIYNRNREGGDLTRDKNGFPVRPALIGNLEARDYDVVYAGLNADGRIGRVNVTGSLYYAGGEDRDNIFTSREADISAYFGAVEASMDFDWARFRMSGLYASGDDNPYDNTEEGFDAIFENPIFAGADTSYWIRQGIPFIGGGRAVGISGRNGVLPSLRSSKEQGQSNFINPGLTLLGVGTDLDLMPELRLSLNANYLWFNETASLEVLRNQGGIAREIGADVSAAVIYRPNFIQNIVLRTSLAALIPGQGLKQLNDNSDGDDVYYSLLFNAILSY